MVSLVTPNSTSTAPDHEHCWQECVRDLEQMLTCRKTFLPAWGQFTLISCTLGYKPWCYGEAYASVLMVTAWGQVYHLQCIHPSQNKTQTDCVHDLIVWIFFCVYYAWVSASVPQEDNTDTSTTKYSETASKQPVASDIWMHLHVSEVPVCVGTDMFVQNWSQLHYCLELGPLYLWHSVSVWPGILTWSSQTQYNSLVPWTSGWWVIPFSYDFK